MDCKISLPNEVNILFHHSLSLLCVLGRFTNSFVILFRQLVLEILRHVNWADLCSVADVCPRLKALARTIFSSKWKKFKLIVNSAEDVENCVRHFGAQINSLSLIPTKLFQIGDFESVLNSLVGNCSETLTALEIHRFMFDCNVKLIEKSEPLFSHLHTLILRDSVMAVGWLDICSELNEFTLIRSTVTGRRPHLQSQASMLLTIKIEDMEYVADGVFGKLRRSSKPNITLDRKDMMRVFNFINRARNQLVPVTQLEIASNVFEYSADAAISKFDRLKSLKIFTPVGYESDHLIAALRNLNELCVLGYRCIACKFTADYLLKLIDTAKNLHHLSIAFEENLALKLNEESYREFLGAVGQRSNAKPLHVTFICKECDFNAIDIPSNRMAPSLYISKLTI